jgi:hypothetical protein
MDFQELMRTRFEAVIERATGRRVIGFTAPALQQGQLHA